MAVVQETDASGLDPVAQGRFPSRKLAELPSITPISPLAMGSPIIGSDQLDFAYSKLPAPNRAAAHEGVEALDYLNGGNPHANLLHIQQNGDATSDPLPRSGSTSDLPSLKPKPGPASTGDLPEFPALPLPRRSVQFARSEMPVASASSHSRTGSWDARDALGKIRGSFLMSKLMELAGPSSTGSSLREGRGSSLPPGSNASSPDLTRTGSRNHYSPGESSQDDADAEETADEAGAQHASKRKRRIRRTPRPMFDSHSTPTTPRLAPSGTELGPSRLNFMRRATAPDAAVDVAERGGLSEGEGRDHLNRKRALMGPRGRSWLHGRGQDTESPSGRRRGHLSRRSIFGASDGDAMVARRPRFGSDRATTFGATKWRNVKKTLKLLRQKSQQESFEYLRSSELMAELRAGAPAVLMLASMIQRDERGNKRIPVLLEQLKIRIRDSTPIRDKENKENSRHWAFTIELEYGSGPSRMTWSIKRTVREILNLHWKYKLLNAATKDKLPPGHVDRKLKQPGFPMSAFPYLRAVRGMAEEEEEEQHEDQEEGQENDAPGVDDSVIAEETGEEATGADGSDVEGRIPKRRKNRIGMLKPRRRLSMLADPSGSTAEGSFMDAATARRKYLERQRSQLEKYLQDMNRWLMFRPDSNRLCRFLELSALGVRLAAEGSYHGKECYLHIRSSKGLDFRRVLTPAKIVNRHSRKWFLVRQSYIACVESPENMNIYDVYLVDPKFMIVSKSKTKRLLLFGKKGGKQEGEEDDNEDIENMDLTAEPSTKKHHTIKLITTEREVKLYSRNQALVHQFEESILEMLKSTPWNRRNRFGSFAPVRTGVYAQWLVDGRDYMWNVSRAISMARDVIYIHDWWLSPELYMRRPACISQKWRLDRLLQRKAREGVKIFVILYRNVEAAVPIDSEYTKFSLLNLHPNIFVQRSPHQFKKNQFFYAHHEKICIVDHDVAFVGGVDLCFGRWDTPQHPVSDDKPTGFETDIDVPKDSEHCQLFPGKDYSNPRVQDFFRLDEPYEEMYDRSRIPRMPWHDIAMQVVGQPARDLTRHFVQRWNYVRRGRNPTRPTPFLLPPPDYKREAVEALGLDGTCEVQILRSASEWSLGIDDFEASIQRAYVKMIEDSEHFVYIENQFFISSTTVLNTKIHNEIGDALVRRIMAAHEKREDWRAVIIIPLMPGFQNEITDNDATSVRMILQCQFRSICRSSDSVFGRLRAVGIEPEDYIQFFSLRQWGKIGSGMLATEQLYIHAKCIIVDDRIALIGSANINERSMLGTRDSECAAIVRDTDMIQSTMAGRPYQVGRFAHTLRLRLMREHIGLDVDEIVEEEREGDREHEEGLDSGMYSPVGMDRIYGSGDNSDEEEDDEEDLDTDEGVAALAESSSRRKSTSDVPESPQSRRSLRPAPLPRATSVNRDADMERESYVGKGKAPMPNGAKPATTNQAHTEEVSGLGPDRWKRFREQHLDEGRDTVVVNGREVLVRGIAPEGKGTLETPDPAVPADHGLAGGARRCGGGGHKEEALPPVPAFSRRTTEQLGLLRANQLPSLPVLDDSDIGGPGVQLDPATGKPVEEQDAAEAALPAWVDFDMRPIPKKAVHKNCMIDPLDPAFYDDIWSRAAENNTKIYRRVFRCQPDSEARGWNEYRDFRRYAAKFQAHMEAEAGRHRSSEESSRAATAAAAKRQSQQGGRGGSVGTPNPDTMPHHPMGRHAEEKEKQQKGGSEKGAAAEEEKPPVVDGDEGDHPSMGVLDEKSGGALEVELPTPVVGTTPTDAEKTVPFPVLDNNNFLQVVSPPAKREAVACCPGSGEKQQANNKEATRKVSISQQQQAQPSPGSTGTQQRRRRRATTRGSRTAAAASSYVEDIQMLSIGEAEELLNLTTGSIVQFPYDWMVTEDMNNNWLFQVDQVAPLQIYS